MSTLLCLHCGFNNPPGMRFCGNCGNKLPVDTSSLVASAASQEYLPETVGVMIGADLMERFRVAGLNAAGQRRTVSILFADLSGFTVLSRMLDTEEVFLIIQQFMNMLIKDVYKYDGMVDKMMGDGLMAIFGAPIGHENHPELALRSASDMMNDIRQFNHQIHERYGSHIKKELQLSMHIALHSGEVIVGGIGSNMLLNYTAIGDTVNLTSRLLGEANPGVILVSETVHQRVQDLAEFQPAGPFWLKGYDNPIPAYQLVRLIGVDQNTSQVRTIYSPMIGRDVELAELMAKSDMVEHLQSGKIVVIDGEAGIGKSRLINEYRTALHERGRISITGHCYTYKKTIQYWVLQDILRHYLNLSGGESQTELIKQISKHIEKIPHYSKPETVQLLLWVLGSLPQAEFKQTRLGFLDPEQLQREVFTVIREVLLQAAGRHPLVLIFEDMHWADESSLQFLGFILNKLRQSPVLVIVTTRTTTDEGIARFLKVASVGNADFLTKISLERLNENSSVQLVKYLLTPGDITTVVLDQIIHLGNGNPFFIEELVRTFIEQGIILHQEGQGWKSADKAVTELAISIPDTIQGLIMSRFDRLSEVQRRMLQVASIIGRDFNSHLLRDVLRITDPLLFEEILQQLVDRGILDRYSDFKGQDFRFTHILMSDTIYSSILSGDKRELHGLIGESMEALYESRVDEQMDVLAQHYLYSSNGSKALFYSIRAGTLSAEKYAIDQARSYFNQAEALLATIPHQHHQAAEVYSGLGTMQVFRGEYQPALGSYTKAIQRLEEGVCSKEDYLQLSRTHRLMAEVYEKLGMYPDALEQLSQAREILKRTENTDPIEAIFQMHDLGWVQFRQGNLAEAEQTMLTGLQQLDESRQPALYASFCNRIAGVYYQQSRFDESIQFLERSITLREKIGDQVAVSRSSNNLGLLQWKMGHWDDALASFQRSLKSHQQVGDVEGEVNVLSNLGLLMIDRGDLTDAGQNLTKALDQATQLNLTYHIAMIHLHLTKLNYLTGRLDQAMDFALKGTELFAGIHSQEVLADLKVYEGLIWLARGEIASARQCAEKAVQLTDEVNGENKVTDDRARAYRLSARVAMAVNDFKLAKMRLLLSDEIFQQTGDELEQARNWVLSAALSEKMNDPREATRLRDQARTVFERFGARGDLAELTPN